MLCFTLRSASALAVVLLTASCAAYDIDASQQAIAAAGDSTAEWNELLDNTTPFGEPDPTSNAYQFVDDHPFEWFDISATGTELRLADDGAEVVELPFSFYFYDAEYTSLSVAANGVVAFANTDKFRATNIGLPTSVDEGAAFVAVHWDDILPLLTSSVRYQIDGEEPNRRLTVQWNGVVHFQEPGTDPGASFGAVFFETSNLIVLQYNSLAFGSVDLDDGASATIGTQASESFGQTYSVNSAALRDGLAILVQVDGCGADNLCNDECRYDPDCPVCIADGMCNDICATDPDCPTCEMDDFCNEDCDDDPDCAAAAACIADDVCEEGCDADPDCLNCEGNGVCDPKCPSDPDCDGGCRTAHPAGGPVLTLIFLVVLLALRRPRERYGDSARR